MLVQDSNLFKHLANNLELWALSSVVEHFLGMEGAAGATAKTGFLSCLKPAFDAIPAESMSGCGHFLGDSCKDCPLISDSQLFLFVDHNVTPFHDTIYKSWDTLGSI